MPAPAYLSIEGIRQGLITKGAFTEASVGNIYVEGHEDEVLVQAFNHWISVPCDLQSGQPTGQRMHESLIIAKVFDKCSPRLYQALTTGERLIKVKIKWYRTSASGTQEHYFTMELEDAVIVNISSQMNNCQDPAKACHTHLEAVAFTYRKISWTHDAAGTLACDDWRTPKI